MIPINNLTIAIGLFFPLVGVFSLVLVSSPKSFADEFMSKEDD